jgi:transcriptional regulator with XRE-family HTH domain
MVEKKTKNRGAVVLCGASLVKAREAKGWVQEDLARAIKRDVRTVQRAEAEESIDMTTADLISMALGVVPFARLIKPERMLLQPNGPPTERLWFQGTIDVPADMVDVLRKEQFALKCFILLRALDLLRDGAMQIELRPANSVAICAYLSKADIQRILDAFLSTELVDYNFIGTCILTANPVLLSAAESGTSPSQQVGPNPITLTLSYVNRTPGTLVLRYAGDQKEAQDYVNQFQATFAPNEPMILKDIAAETIRLTLITSPAAALKLLLNFNPYPSSTTALDRFGIDAITFHDDSGLPKDQREIRHETGHSILQAATEHFRAMNRK